ncbi:MAG: hypothetical protein RI995_1414, partial [Bacteroidota bacterium]
FDGERAGAGVAVENFDLDIFAEYLPHHESIEGQFHWWCEKGKNLMLGHLESLYLPPAPSFARRGWLRSLSLSKG